MIPFISTVGIAKLNWKEISKSTLAGEELEEVSTEATHIIDTRRNTVVVQSVDNIALVSTASRKIYLEHFLQREEVYKQEIEGGFTRLSSHLSILNHLAGGVCIETNDEKLVAELEEISSYFIQVDWWH